MTERTRFVRLLAYLGTLAVIAIPFVSVTILPVTDLAQHISQVRLFYEALGPESERLAIQYDTPYWLGYLIPISFWKFLEPLAVAKWSMFALAAGWVTAIHGLAAEFDRSPISAVIASTLVFCESFYWGYFTFYAGFPVFVAWIIFSIHEYDWPLQWRLAGHLFGLTLLYFSHILWLAVGLCWLALQTIVLKESSVESLSVRAIATSAAVIAGISWYLHMPAGDLTSETRWLNLPHLRLAPGWLTHAAFGTLRNYFRFIVSGTVFVWLAVSAYSAYRSRSDSTESETTTEPGSDSVHSELLAVAGLLIVLSLTLPDKFALTISFGKRWLAPGLILLFLSLPTPDIRPRLLATLAGALLFSSCIYTGSIWLEYESEELSGLIQAVRAVDRDARVLGLDLRKKSPRVTGRPFIQMFAYAQVLRSADLNFSFADRRQFPVVYSPPRARPWTIGLEWYPERVKTSDFEHFDYVVANGGTRGYDRFSSTTRLNPVSPRDQIWHAYRVEPE